MGRTLRVDMDDVVEAIDAGPSDPLAFLDPETGELHFVFEDHLDAGEPEIDLDDPRYVEVPRTEARDEVSEMERFALALEEEDLRALFLRVLGGKGTFRRFHDLLREYPDLGGRWEAEKHARHLQMALDWFEALGIVPDYELVRQPPASRQAAPPEASARPIGLIDLLLLGAPEGRTELIGGRVRRELVRQGPAAARKVFARVARQIATWEGLGWRKRYIEGKDTFAHGRWHLSVDQQVVSLEVEVDPAAWRAFG